MGHGKVLIQAARDPGPVGGARDPRSEKRGQESEHAIAIIPGVRRAGNSGFSFDRERWTDIVESSICLDLSQRI
jgi:hypothetical protein